VKPSRGVKSVATRRQQSAWHYNLTIYAAVSLFLGLTSARRSPPIVPERVMANAKKRKKISVDTLKGGW
jgi:hypothetical protein